MKLPKWSASQRNFEAFIGSHWAQLRGHIQTILEKINVIMTLGGEGV